MEFGKQEELEKQLEVEENGNGNMEVTTRVVIGTGRVGVPFARPRRWRAGDSLYVKVLLPEGNNWVARHVPSSAVPSDAHSGLQYTSCTGLTFFRRYRLDVGGDGTIDDVRRVRTYLSDEQDVLKAWSAFKMFDRVEEIDPIETEPENFINHFLLCQINLHDMMKARDNRPFKRALYLDVHNHGYRLFLARPPAWTDVIPAWAVKVISEDKSPFGKGADVLVLTDSPGATSPSTARFAGAVEEVTISRGEEPVHIMDWFLEVDVVRGAESVRLRYPEVDVDLTDAFCITFLPSESEDTVVRLKRGNSVIEITLLGGFEVTLWFVLVPSPDESGEEEEGW